MGSTFTTSAFIINLTFRLCGPGSTSKLSNLCNPAVGDEWVDGYNTDIKDVLGTGGIWGKKLEIWYYNIHKYINFNKLSFSNLFKNNLHVQLNKNILIFSKNLSSCYVVK